MAWTTPSTWAGGAGQYLLASALNEQIRDNSGFLKVNTAWGAAASLTVSGGVITKTQSYHKVIGESTAADDIDTISGGTEGEVLLIRPNGYALTLKNGTGNLTLGRDVKLAADTDHMALIYGSDSTWHPLEAPRTTTFLVNTFICPAPGTDWTPQLEGVGLAAEKTSKKCWLPLNFLKVGDIITTYNLVGDATEAATMTLDCKLVQVNKADPLTTTDVTDGAIVQVTADGVVDSAANPTDTTVATDKQYVLEILGTTGAGDSITLTGAEVVVTRLY